MLWSNTAACSINSTVWLAQQIRESSALSLLPIAQSHFQISPEILFRICLPDFFDNFTLSADQHGLRQISDSSTFPLDPIVHLINKGLADFSMPYFFILKEFWTFSCSQILIPCGFANYRTRNYMNLIVNTNLLCLRHSLFI